MSANKDDSCIIDMPPDSDEDETTIDKPANKVPALKVDEMASDVSLSGTGKVQESNADGNKDDFIIDIPADSVSVDEMAPDVSLSGTGNVQESNADGIQERSLCLPNKSTLITLLKSWTTNPISSFYTATPPPTSEIQDQFPLENEHSLKKKKLPSPAPPLEDWVNNSIISHSTSQELQVVLETIKKRTPQYYRTDGLDRQELSLILAYHPRLVKKFKGFLLLEQLADRLQDNTIEEGYYLVSNENVKKMGEKIHCTFLMMVVFHKDQRNCLYFDPQGKVPDNLVKGVELNPDPENNDRRVVWKESKLQMKGNKPDTVVWWNMSTLQKPFYTCALDCLMFFDKLTRYHISTDFPPTIHFDKDPIDYFVEEILPAVIIK